MVEISITNTFSIEIYQIKPKKSSFFYQSIFLLSHVFYTFCFLLYSIDLCTSLIIKALMVLILFYVVVCSRCILVEKDSWDFWRKLQQKILVHCVSILGLGYIRIREIRLTSFWTTHCSTLTDFDSGYKFRDW